MQWFWRSIAAGLAGLALASAGCDAVPGGTVSSARGIPPHAKEAAPVAVAVPVTAVEADGLKKITFEDLDIGMQPDSVYEPWMLTAHVQSLVGQRVRITGFMSAAILQAGSQIRTFPLLREQECPFGPGGQAHHVIEVELQDKLRTSFRTGPVTVEGVLTVRPWIGPNGKTWSLYHLEGTKVE